MNTNVSNKAIEINVVVLGFFINLEICHGLLKVREETYCILWIVLQYINSICWKLSCKDHSNTGRQKEAHCIWKVLAGKYAYLIPLDWRKLSSMRRMTSPWARLYWTLICNGVRGMLYPTSNSEVLYQLRH